MLLNQQNRKGLEIVASRKLAISRPKFIDFYKPTKNKIMLKNNSLNSNKKLTAKFQLNKNSQEKVFVLNGREAQTLIALVEAKQQGTTALEISSWALRLSAYIFNLRKECGLDIIPIIKFNYT
jgi:hypothetical protein